MKTLAPRVRVLRGRVAVVAAGSWRPVGSSSTARGYGYKWQQARERFLGLHPICVMCQAADIVEVATVVDHKIPHRGDQELFWDQENWQPLCKPCHDRKTQQETHGLGPQVP